MLNSGFRAFAHFAISRFLLIAALAAAVPVSAQGPRPPISRQDNVRETLHGVEVVDPYRWLEDQDSSETRTWIDQQNAYTKATLAAVPGRLRLQRRLTELLKIDAMGAPTVRGGRYFFSKRRADQELSVIYVRKGLGGEDEVLLDPHPLSRDHTTSVSLMNVSQDGKLVAYGVREGGKDEVTVRLMDVDSRKDLPDVLPSARYWGVQLKPDKSGFFYTKHTAQGPRVRYHQLGTDPAQDPVLFGEGYGAEKIIGSELSEDGRWLTATVSYGSAAVKTEIWVQRQGDREFTPIVKDIDAAFYGEVADEQLYMQTDWNAPNGKILAVDLKNPARDKWVEVIPTGEDSMDGFSLTGGKLCVSYLHNASSRVSIFTPKGKRVRDISFPTIGSVSGLTGRWKSDEAFFSFASFHVPSTIYRYDVAKDQREVWYQVKVPVDSSKLVTEQVWYPSKDGTKIPMFLVYRKDLPKDGKRPVFLTGYGGFQSALTPRFSATAAMWAESGGIFAQPSLRGGGEFGENWHRAGMLDKKQNVFDDFIGAAEWLIKEGYTNPSKLAISGGSNGGLLVGAALTQRPELFQAVICSVPLLDMVRYHRFLVARFWVPEYGSADDPEQFKYIYKYSPYHRVKAGTKYPAVLFITGDADTRVAPLHARKMAALLQAATGSDRPILLQYDTKAGHSGGKPLSKIIEDLAEEYAFLYWQLGMKAE